MFCVPLLTRDRRFLFYSHPPPLSPPPCQLQLLALSHFIARPKQVFIKTLGPSHTYEILNSSSDALIRSYWRLLRSKYHWRKPSVKYKFLAIFFAFFFLKKKTPTFQHGLAFAVTKPCLSTLVANTRFCFVHRKSSKR